MSFLRSKAWYPAKARFYSDFEGNIALTHAPYGSRRDPTVLPK